MSPVSRLAWRAVLQGLINRTMAPHGKGRLEGKTTIMAGRKRKLIGEGVRDPDIQASKLGKKAGTSTERCKGKNNRRELTKDVDVTVAEGKGTRDGGKGKKKSSGKDEIDDIFADIKRLKEEKILEEAERAAKKKKIKEEHKLRQANPFRGQENEQNQRWAWAEEVKPVRYDDDGLPIYTWESLRIGQGGGTDLCPFDCDCCF